MIFTGSKGMGRKKIRSLKIELQETLLGPQRKDDRSPWSTKKAAREINTNLNSVEPQRTEQKTASKRTSILESKSPQSVGSINIQRRLLCLTKMQMLVTFTSEKGPWVLWKRPREDIIASQGKIRLWYPKKVFFFLGLAWDEFYRVK